MLTAQVQEPKTNYIEFQQIGDLDFLVQGPYEVFDEKKKQLIKVQPILQPFLLANCADLFAGLILTHSLLGSLTTHSVLRGLLPPRLQGLAGKAGAEKLP